MKSPSRNPDASSDPNGTHHKLLDAAALEFNAHGFHGTDTNRIARRAGFAPQTFYRHFDDKTVVFIEVYDRWQRDERRHTLRAYHAATSSRRQHLAVAAALLRSHTEWRVFRRSLRLLSVEDDRVRRARAASRREQLLAFGLIDTNPATWADGVAALLCIERLCDAAADQEVSDLGVTAKLWLAQIADAIGRLQRTKNLLS